jgi:hypothetical protein
VLDPTWAALAIALEVPVVGALVKVSFDIPRLDDMRPEVKTAKSSAHALFVTTAVLALHAGVDAARRPEQRKRRTASSLRSPSRTPLREEASSPNSTRSLAR